MTSLIASTKTDKMTIGVQNTTTRTNTAPRRSPRIRCLSATKTVDHIFVLAAAFLALKAFPTSLAFSPCLPSRTTRQFPCLKTNKQAQQTQQTQQTQQMQKTHQPCQKFQQFPAPSLSPRKYDCHGRERISNSILYLAKTPESITKNEEKTDTQPTSKTLRTETFFVKNGTPSLETTSSERNMSSEEHGVGGNDDNDDIDQYKMNERALGILVLLTVPLAWGTYTPVVKYMYEKMNPSMPGFLFSAGYYLVAALSLRFLSSYYDLSPGGQSDSLSNDEEVATEVGGETIVDEELGSGLDVEERGILNRGGWELGGYLFLGNGLQVVGLQTVPADRAAFLVQLTTVMVPVVFALSAGTLSAIPIQTWIACIITFLGVIVMGADDGDRGVQSGLDLIESDGSIDFSSGTQLGDFSSQLVSDAFEFDQLSSHLQISTGDVLIILAALAYTMHVVRLGQYAPRTTALRLAASKATVEAFLSVALVFFLVFAGSAESSLPTFVTEMGKEILVYFDALTSTMANGISKTISNDNSFFVSVVAILWTGWITCAYTIYAQSFGQRRINPTDSNLIYTTQPLFSSMFAYFLLDEKLGLYGYIGATMIGTALLLVSLSNKR